MDPSDSPGLFLHFQVRDTREGIPIDKQSLIFSPFTQADSSTTRKHGGTGLGLAISSRIVNMMHGHIWLQSSPGLGSTFHFTARFAATSAPPPSTESVISSLNGLSVLIVDDNATNRKILDHSLRRWGMHPFAVASGAHAFQEIDSACRLNLPFSLILIDGKHAADEWIRSRRKRL